MITIILIIKGSNIENVLFFKVSYFCNNRQHVAASLDRPFLALTSRLGLPTANLSEIQMRRHKMSIAASLGYSSSSLLSISGSASFLHGEGANDPR